VFFYPVGAIKFTFVKYKLVSVDRPLSGLSRNTLLICSGFFKDMATTNSNKRLL
jgi:hypothetical protein